LPVAEVPVLRTYACFVGFSILSFEKNVVECSLKLGRIFGNLQYFASHKTSLFKGVGGDTRRA
jgi:hypothetical protein